MGHKQRSMLYRYLLLGAGVIGFFLLGACQMRLYTAVPPTGQVSPEVLDHLSYLRRTLEEGSAARMQQLFPEGYFFSYVLYGLAWVDVGLQSPAGAVRRQQALTEARWALAHLEDPGATVVFSPALNPPYGMFYAGWRNYLLAGILLLQHPGTPDAVELAAFQERSQEIAAAITAAETPFLPSYPAQAWPVDTLPAIVSLRVYNVVVDDRYEPLIARWLAEAQARLDVETGLMPHRADAVTGQMREGARGSSQTLILRFLADVDPALGQAHYAVFRQQYVVRRFGLPGVLEHPPFRPGQGDIDSGPLLAGVSLSSTAVSLGTARVYGDHALATALWQSGEMGGLPFTWRGQRRYALGLLPVGDAFVVWSKTAVPWLNTSTSVTYAPLLPWWWRWPFHLPALVLAVMTWLFIRRWWPQE